MLVRPRAGAVSARSEYSISVSPIRMMSRSRNCRGAVSLAVLTTVPLALPRSAIQNTSPRLRTSACSREANGSSTHRSLRAERPIVIRGRFRSTTESPRAGVALTIKRGIGQIRLGDGATGRRGDGGTKRRNDVFAFHLSLAPVASSPRPPVALFSSPQSFQNFIHNRFRLARLILNHVFKLIFHRRIFPVIAVFVRFPGRLPGLFRARFGGADIRATVDAPVIIIGFSLEAQTVIGRADEIKEVFVFRSQVQRLQKLVDGRAEFADVEIPHAESLVNFGHAARVRLLFNTGAA